VFNLLVSISLRHRLFVLAAGFLLVLYGSMMLPRLPVDVLPDLTRPTVTVMAETEGLAPEEVERLVTRPIESLLNGIPGVETVRSTSGIGFSVVIAEFSWATDVTLARVRVNERLAGIQAQLPPGVVPQMTSLSSIMGEILLIALTADPGAATSKQSATPSHATASTTPELSQTISRSQSSPFRRWRSSRSRTPNTPVTCCPSARSRTQARSGARPFSLLAPFSATCWGAGCSVSDACWLIARSQ